MSSRRSRSSNSLRNVQPNIIEAEPYLTHTYRYSGAIANTAGLSITALDILGAAGVYTKTSNSSVVPIFSSFRLRRLKVWATTVSGATPVGSVAVIWQGASTAAATDQMMVATSASISVPLFMDMKPPAMSQAAFWNIESSGVIFSIAPTLANTQLVVDLTLDLKMNTGGFSPVGITVVTAALGDTYYLALDGPGTNELLPVGLSSTF